MNPVALSTHIKSEADVAELLQCIQQTVEEAVEHKNYPFQALAEEFNLNKGLNRAPIFQMMLVLCDFPNPLTESPVLQSALDSIREYSNTCDLVLIASEEAKTVHITFEYNAELFTSSTVERFLANFCMLLSGMVSDSRQHISCLPLMTEEERHQLLMDWNNTAVDYPWEKPIHQLVEEQAEKTPDAVAVFFEGQELTYQELNCRANQLAHYLQNLGVKSESLVGICIERSLEMVVGLLGILKSGGAYVPIDPTYPADRIAYMLENSQVPILLTQDHLQATLPEYEGHLICLDADWDSIAAEKQKKLASKFTPEDLIYIIYTSGSTGKPKGTMNTHKGLINRILWMEDEYRLTPEDSVLQKTPFSFDVSGWEFWWTLIMGARLVIAKPEGHKDPNYLIQLITEQHITVLHFVPSMLQIFLENPHVESCSSLKQVFCSGEALPISLQEHFFTHLKAAELHNLYGPTEAAIDVTYWPCQPGTQLSSSVPIGRPVANTQTYILDTRLQPVPVGIAGELYLGGVQLARGYLHRPELTAEQFIENPFADDFQSRRLYKTGDLARYLSDGNIEYLGRIDHQVKLRGFRIELGEIEAALSQHEQVGEAVVVLYERDDNKFLAAYITAAGGRDTADISELRSWLRQRLPEYMIPTSFTVLDSLPLTPNGKTDRKALPEPELINRRLDESFVAPRDALEQQVA
ncbi:MAG: amino acid adenylation domain-containing protein, partial [Candidatus Electrothrix sp. AR3]|nr:amino acid adenylation domain-containing protein [Candidatus Electrothrix sp. AR3]